MNSTPDLRRAIRSELSDLLSESPSAADLRAADSRKKAIAAAGANGIVLVGAGVIGRGLFAHLRELGICVLAMADNDPSKHGFNVFAGGGVCVYSPRLAVRSFPDAQFVVTVLRDNGALIDQLRTLKAGNVRTFEDFCSWYWCLSSVDQTALPSDVLREKATILRVYDLLGDDESRVDFLTQVKYRLCHPVTFPPHHDIRRQYFWPELFDVGDCFVDGGAFDGDTVRHLLSLSAADPAAVAIPPSIVCFEPDPENYQKLLAWSKTVPHNIRCHRAALAEGDGVAYFVVRSDQSSKIDPNNPDARMIATTSLDHALGADCPTFIKLDVEGVECFAIRGGRQTIGANRPVMAVCVYHDQDDLWNLPDQLATMLPDSAVFLRRHGPLCWEQYVLVIPRERLKSPAVQK